MNKRINIQTKDRRLQTIDHAVCGEIKGFVYRFFNMVKVFSLWSVVCCLFFASILMGTGCARPLYKKKFIISGTYLEVSSPDRRAAKIVYREFRRLDEIFNLYNKRSELSRLNRTYNKPFKASDELIELLQKAENIYNLSEGAFDVTYGSLYKFWKGLIRGGKPKKFPTPEVIAKIKEAGGIDGVEIDPKKGIVIIKKKGLTIDLSGIAKGYMVDKAISRLKEKGINSALINAGGDIYCLGMDAESPWDVGVQDPEMLSEILGVQLLIDEAIATSGGYEQFFTFKGKEYSHLIDPRKGYPVDNDLISVSVISKNCTTADSLATTFSILGLEGVEKFLSKNPSTMRVFLVRSVGEDKHIHIFK